MENNKNWVLIAKEPIGYEEYKFKDIDNICKFFNKYNVKYKINEQSLLVDNDYSVLVREIYIENGSLEQTLNPKEIIQVSNSLDNLKKDFDKKIWANVYYRKLKRITSSEKYKIMKLLKLKDASYREINGRLNLLTNNKEYIEDCNNNIISDFERLEESKYKSLNYNLELFKLNYRLFYLLQVSEKIHNFKVFLLKKIIKEYQSYNEEIRKIENRYPEIFYRKVAKNS